MLYAEKIKMLKNKEKSYDLLEIDEIYVTNLGWHKKSYYYDYLKENPSSIAVDIYPYPKLIKQLSSNNEKYVKSEPDKYGYDNLLNLPRI